MLVHVHRQISKHGTSAIQHHHHTIMLDNKSKRSQQKLAAVPTGDSVPTGESIYPLRMTQEELHASVHERATGRPVTD